MVIFHCYVSSPEGSLFCSGNIKKDKDSKLSSIHELGDTHGGVLQADPEVMVTEHPEV